MEDNNPAVTPHPTPTGTHVRLSGNWTAARLAEPVTWKQIEAALAGAMLAADLTMGVTPAYFFEALPLGRCRFPT